MEKVYLVGATAKGGTLWPIIRLLKHFYDVEFLPYKRLGLAMSRHEHYLDMISSGHLQFI